MSEPRKFFTKGERELLYGILNGRAAKTNGVPVSLFLPRILDLLPRSLNLDTKKLAQRMHFSANIQEVWRAVHQIAEEERPGLFDELSANLDYNVAIIRSIRSPRGRKKKQVEAV